MWYPHPLLGLLAFLVEVSARSLDFPQLHNQNPSRGRYYGYTKSSLDSSRPKPVFPRRPAQRPSGFIALGDSYSAGIGTGVNGTEDPCRLGQHAHPFLINKDLVEIEGPNTTSFQFLSCTGSAIDDLLVDSDPSQIHGFNTSTTADFALLSVGGNDLGFFDIMNSCIFRFYSFYSGTCEEALQRSEAQLASTDFENNLRLVITEILDRVHWEKRPWFTITITGYARFFNAETKDCDDRSFGVWWRGPKLKRALRQRVNEMVVAVNAKIKSSVEAVNAGFAQRKVLFVDYDSLFEGHRFCEEGVVEPDYRRNETWFFLVGGPDNADVQVGEMIYREEAIRKSTSPDSLLIDPETCMQTSAISGDWGERALCNMAMTAHRDPSIRLASGDGVSEQDMWYVPTYYGQTFHPVSIFLYFLVLRPRERWLGFERFVLTPM